MIKLFDYKFILILSLSLVVYFLYREIELIKSKHLNNFKLIENIKTNENKINQIDESLNKIYLDNQELKVVISNLVKQYNTINIPIKPKTPVITESVQSTELEILEKKLHKLDKTIHTKISEHSTEQQTDLNLEKTEEDVITNISEEKEEINEVIEEILEKQEVQEDIIVDNEVIVKNEDKDIVDNEEEDMELPNSSCELEIFSNDEVEKKISELMKNKLGELQDMAERLKIEILKENNGKSKKKTKLELVEEIVSKNI